MKDTGFYYVAIIAIFIYFVALRSFDFNTTSTIITTVATIIGGVAIWIQLRREKDLKETEFLMNYNNEFVNNEESTKVEKALEDYFKGRVGEDVFTTLERQSIINYLVCLEAFAALIIKGVVKYKTIDNLFSYRFFLAVNNKVMQELELVCDAEFYKGIYIVHKQWSKYKRRKRLPILMNSTSLELVKNYDHYSNNGKPLITTTKLHKKDNLAQVAKLIYQTDEFIYPPLFTNKQEGIKVLKTILEANNTIFCRENIIVAKRRNKIVGILVYLNKNNDWDNFTLDTPEYVNLDIWNDVTTNYFKTLFDHCHNSEVYISNISVDEEFQHQGVGTKLLKHLEYSVVGNTYTLHVLADNAQAITFYEKNKFVRMSEEPGYAPKGFGSPLTYFMKKTDLS